MSILGRLLRDLLPSRGAAVPPSAGQSPDPSSGDVYYALFKLHQAAVLDLNMRIDREMRTLRADPRFAAPERLERFGRKVWSQNDEDGILEEIFRRIGTGQRNFVEFGVTDGRECNTLKLLVEGWRGLWMEPDAAACARIRNTFHPYLSDSRLRLLETRVTAENIDSLIRTSGVAPDGELDLLSIDIDGNDYHVLGGVRALQPRVLVIEYNGKFPPPMDVVPPYEPDSVWNGSDFAGASLQAISSLAARRGYRLVGTNITGVNAFFVRSDLAGAHFSEPDAAALYNPARYWLSSAYASGHPPGERFDYTSDAVLAAAGQATPRRQE